jgi:hypothetical protein
LHPASIVHGDRFGSIFIGNRGSHKTKPRIIAIGRPEVVREPSKSLMKPSDEKLFRWHPDPRSDYFSFIDPWQRAQRVVASWESLGDDWDDQGAAAPDPGALRGLQSLLVRGRSAGISAPTPFITGDPEVGLSWSVGNRVATASFLAGGRFLAYCPTNQGKAFRIDGKFGEADIRGFLAAIGRLS